ncbi:MAG: ABC transporter substrate-binding protein [Oscillospiraceae bacterium]
MKKVLALILSLCMVFALLAGCSDEGAKENTSNSPAPNSSPSDGGTSGNDWSPAVVDNDLLEIRDSANGLQILDEYLAERVVVSSSGSGGSLAPFGRTDWGNVACRDLIYQKLCRVDTLPGSPTQGEYYLEMAKSIEKEDDLTYVITLWDNIYDSAGNHFTASDVVYSIDSYIATGNKGGMSRLDHLEIVDDYTLIWHCKAPFGQGELGRQMSNANMVCEAAFEASPDGMTNTPVGTGPYTLKELDSSSYCILEVNENFWMRNLDEEVRENLWVYCCQNVREVEYRIIKENSSRAIALEMGTIDAADSLAEVDMKQFSTDPKYTPINVMVQPPVPLLFNCSDTSPCSSVELRKAICYAVDSAAVAEGVECPAFQVYGFEPNLVDAPDSWIEGREYYDYDPDTARDLLAQSGYNNETITIMYVNSSSAYEGAVIMVQSQLEALGLKVEQLCVEQSVYEVYEADPTKWDIRLDTYGGGDYCANCYKYLYSGYVEETLHGLTPMLVEDKKLDALYEAMEAEPTEENITAYDDYFTYEMCYGIGVIGYYKQTAALAHVNPVLGDRGALVPNAFTFDD